LKGKVARQLRQLCYVKGEEILSPQLLVVDTRKGLKMVLSSEGEHVTPDGQFRYDIVEEERDVTRLSADPVRQVYKDLKNQWYGFTKSDHKRVQKDAKEV